MQPNPPTDSSPPDSSPANSAVDAPEPRWPAMIAMLAVAGIYMALPDSLSVGPRWLQLVIVAALLIPLEVTRRRDHPRANIVLGHLVSSVVTLFMVWSLVLLLKAVPAHKEAPLTMLRSAGALWLTNILVFAGWYWRLDAGGPHGRDQIPGHTTGSFLFPQMTIDEPQNDANRDATIPLWSPNFVDYLFLAFNTSTAFSPTDTPVLSRWAKLLTMIQSVISLAVVAVLAARAVNIL